MDDEFWNEILDDTVKDIRCFIDVEGQYVMKEHDVIERFYTFNTILGYLENRIPKENIRYHALMTEMMDILKDIEIKIRKNVYAELRIKADEENTLHQLSDEARRKNWQAVRGDKIPILKKKGDKVLELQVYELRELHTAFMDMMKLMKKTNLFKGIHGDLTVIKGKGEYDTEEEYYFVELYKFCRAYERIFRHLWKKERQIQTKLVEDSKKLK